jgi:hypothetical protein
MIIEPIQKPTDDIMSEEGPDIPSVDMDEE